MTDSQNDLQPDGYLMQSAETEEQPPQIVPGLAVASQWSIAEPLMSQIQALRIHLAEHYGMTPTVQAKFNSIEQEVKRLDSKLGNSYEEIYDSLENLQEVVVRNQETLSQHSRKHNELSREASNQATDLIQKHSESVESKLTRLETKLDNSCEKLSVEIMEDVKTQYTNLNTKLDQKMEEFKQDMVKILKDKDSKKFIQ